MMRMENRCLRIAILMLTIIISIQVLGISAQLPPPCKSDLPVVLHSCYPFVAAQFPQVPPTQDCCDFLKACDILYFCKDLALGFQTYISLKKFIYVATTCGCPIPPPGDNCGSYTIPVPPPPGVVPSLPPLKA